MRSTQFRQWSNKVLKEYLLRGYSVNQRLLYMESRIDRRLAEHDRRLDELTDKVDLFVISDQFAGRTFMFLSTFDCSLKKFS